jgi:dihydroxyacetone kinase-like predicted kinase
MAPDHDVEGHFDVLLGHLNAEHWQDLWQRLDIKVQSFESLGLSAAAADRLVWQVCQSQQVMLVTANRNDDGPDSLAATIRECNTTQCLPVFTLANKDRILESSAYAAEVVERLLDYIMYIDDLRGTGRVWLP